MMAPEFTLRDDFPPVDRARWSELVEASLDGASVQEKLTTHTHDGIAIQPLYTGQDLTHGHDLFGYPGFYPFVRGGKPFGAARAGWDLCQEHAHPDLQVTNRAILQDLQGGVTSLLLQLDAAACRGFDPDDAMAEELAGRGGLTAYGVDDLDAALAQVDLEMVRTTLDAGAAFVPAAALLVGLWRRRQVAPDKSRGAFNADPLGVLARTGELPVTSAEAFRLMTDLATWTAENFAQVTAVGVDTSPYHDTGATDAQDIAYALATGVEYVRAMCRAGMGVDDAVRQMQFRFSLGTHHFLAIAKLRAARQLWARVVEVCGGSHSATAMRIHARIGNRVLTQREPYVNLLRNTASVFAACLGGADAITSTPFDSRNGLPDDFSRRIARNTLLVLQDEADLNRVIDPAGGSWFLDHLTGQLAEKSWGIFQEIERQGGMLAALQSGWLAQQIDTVFAAQADDIACGRQAIVGLSEYPDLGEPRHLPSLPDPRALRTLAAERLATTRASAARLATLSGAVQPTAVAAEAAARGASIGQMARALGFHKAWCQASALELRPLAQPFEELRDASDDWQARHGKRPRAFLAGLGPVSRHAARAMYAKNFFEAGGFEVVGGEGSGDVAAVVAAFSGVDGRVAVVCSSDQRYPKLVPQIGPKLKTAGAISVVLVGDAGEHEAAWREAGIDHFIFAGCDMLSILRQLLREEGVLAS